MAIKKTPPKYFGMATWTIQVMYDPGGMGRSVKELISANAVISATSLDPDTLESAVQLEAKKLLHSIKFKAIMEGVDLG